MLLVQCDFDDTVAVGNVSAAIRQAFALDEWRRVEEEYMAGGHTVEENNIRQFALVRASEQEIRDFVHTSAVVRDGFQGFVDYCHQEGIRLSIVSSGLDLYIKPVMRRVGLDHVEVHSGTATVTQSGVRVEYTGPSGALITQGFKESFVRHYKSGGYTVVYIGDGLSDIAPAAGADYVIARSTLEQHLRASGIQCYGFHTFDDVVGHLQDIQRAAQSGQRKSFRKRSW